MRLNAFMTSVWPRSKGDTDHRSDPAANRIGIDDRHLGLNDLSVAQALDSALHRRRG